MEQAHIPFLLASPEKALLDTYYLATRKGRRFVRLPELDLTASGFSARRFSQMLRRHPLPLSVRNAIVRRGADHLTPNTNSRGNHRDPAVPLGSTGSGW